MVEGWREMGEREEGEEEGEGEGRGRKGRGTKVWQHPVCTLEEQCLIHREYLLGGSSSSI